MTVGALAYRESVTYATQERAGEDAVRLARSAPFVAVDIETAGLAERAYQLKAVVIATAGHAAVLDATEPAHRRAAMDALAVARSIVMHNSSFDAPLLVHDGLMALDAVEKVTDTVILARLAYPGDLVRKDLGALRARLLSEHTKDSFKGFAKVQKIKLSEAFARFGYRDPAYVMYAAADGVSTAALLPLLLHAARNRLTTHPFGRLGADAETAEHIIEREQVVNRVLLRRSARGLAVDIEVIESEQTRLSEAMLDLEHELADLGVARATNRGDLIGALGDAIPPEYPRTGKTKAPSTKGKDLALLNHPAAKAFVAYDDVRRLFGYLEQARAIASYAGGRIHPQVQVMVATTGRMSYGTPALQQFTDAARRAIQAEAGESLTSLDWCLDQDTSIETLTGPVKIKDIAVGEKVYSWRAGRVTWGLVTAVQCTGYQECAEVILDNGKSFIASWDHRMLRRSGDEVKVSDLISGDSLAALRWGTNGPVEYQYLTVYSRSNREYTKVHRLVAEAFHGPCPPGGQVHHKDHDRTNNRPDNLEYLSQQDHLARHTSFVNVNKSKRVAALRDGLARRRSYVGAGNPNFGKLLGEHQTCATCDLRFYVPRATLSRGGGKFCSRECYTTARCGQINHNVVEVRPIGKRRTYDITVEDSHNFALSCGVFSHNCQIEPIVAANLAKDATALQVYETGAHGDLYQGVADYAKITRKHAKVVLLADLYGQGVRRLALGLGVDEAEAKKIKSQVAKALPRTAALVRSSRKWGAQYGLIFTMSGRIIPIDRGFDYRATNYLVQGSAYDVLSETLYRTHEHDLADAVYLAMHDELVVATEAAEDVRRIMETPPARLVEIVKRTPVLRTDRADLGAHWRAT